ncbi:MAG TPA: glycosyl transferase family 36, partial [Fervidobacterium sp.]|nr:glycosyl transferase family 36 [Fervidobacterium sp.]
DKESFLGMYRTLENPVAMEERLLKRNVGRFGDGIASLQVEVKLDPGEIKKLVFTLGCADDEKSALELSKIYNSVDKANEAFEEVQKFWAQFIEPEKIETPDDG